MRKHLGLVIVGCLTLGLAPYYPHAHIWKQITNIWYGRPMAGMDWLDLLMHGIPWILLLYILGEMVFKKSAKSK